MHLKRFFLLAILFAPLALSAITFTFPENADQWEGDFADYPYGEEAFYELKWGWSPLPTPVQTSSGLLKNGLFLSGNNHSDDLFMFVRRKMKGLKPNAVYALTFSVLIESDVPVGSVGVGGSPGESVFFKVGGSERKPEKVLADNFYRLNLDKGEQSHGGENAQVIGNLANRAVKREDRRFLPKELLSHEPLLVRSNEKGEIWLFLGTDSGFEGITTFYIAKIEVQLEEHS